MTPFADLRQDFFREHLSLHPEEATTLGVHDHDDRFHDGRPEAIEHELAFYRRTLAALDALPSAGEDALDAAAMRQVCTFQLHHYERGWHTRNLERSLTPYNVLQYHRTQVEEDGEDAAAYRARLSAVPATLDRQEALLRAGLADGWRPDALIVDEFAHHLLPAAAHDLGPQDREAGLAYARHAQFYVDVLARAAAPGAGVLGPLECAWRLEHMVGTTEPADALRERARKALSECREAICALAGVPSSRDAALVLKEAETATPERPEDVIPLYREVERRAVDLIREQRLFSLPEPLDLGMKPTPEAMRHFARGTNWPAPLLDRKKRGWFVVHPDPKRHSIVWSGMLAVHEGIPGHFLQSATWQARFGDSEAPVRFLRIADDVAQSRNDWGAMPNIEGWAVYAEEVMRAHGFHAGASHLAAWAAHAWRAARLVVDVSLHRGEMSVEEGVAFLQEHALASEAAARAELLRYLRIPLQASTYLLGRLEIEALRDRVRSRLGDAFDLRAFHDRFLDFGPVHPSWMDVEAFARAGSAGSG